jgi:DNA (cytosine-5)-methyltransferase 1
MPGQPLALDSIGAFAGIGGVELGFQRAGISTSTLIEYWEPARAVLTERMPNARLLGDVRNVKTLPRADVFSGGFPCTDLSQAGLTAGIGGDQSGLVHEIFRLLPKVRPTWLVLENVRNMLALDRGRAMHVLADELENRGYRWAYRLIDSRAFGTAQRRQRVLLVASKTDDPRRVLFADEAGEPPADYFRDDAFGFYWTEGLRGLGWARDAVPTLKGGSAIGIPSPPAFWVRGAVPGRAMLTPTIEDAESLQGFPRGWTAPASGVGRRGEGMRWKAVGNAVTVGASRWLGGRLVSPGESIAEYQLLGSRWPTAAWGEKGQRRCAELSLWPVCAPYGHLLDTVTISEARTVSLRGATGFLSRLDRGSLRVNPEFRVAVKEHIAELAATTRGTEAPIS